MRLKNGEACLGWPLSQHILTQGWYYNDGSLHQAIDMRAIVGTPVMAAEEGTVEIVYHWNGKRTQGDTNSYGNMVKIRHANWNGGTLHTLYAHLNSINVKQGQVVKTGEVIGYSGNTGNSFGAHLHFEVRWKNKRTNPLVWLDNNFTTATDKVFTFRTGEHSVDKSVGESDKPASANKQPADSAAVELWGIGIEVSGQYQLAQSSGCRCKVCDAESCIH